MPASIPVFVLTGFLGAGKTTLLNRLLKHPALADTAVVINEFGDAGLDHLLVEEAGEDVVLLSSGCVCCSLRGDLADTLCDLARRRAEGLLPPFARVVIETSGMAHPVPVLQTLLAPQVMAAGYSLAGVTALADAVRGQTLVEEQAECAAQLAVADRILVTKADLVADVSGFLAFLARLNPQAETGFVENFEPADLLSPRFVTRPGARPAFVAHDGGLTSFVLTSAKPLQPHRCAGFLDELRERYGTNLLRFKALLRVAGSDDRPVVVHGVQHMMHPPQRLAAWPGGMRESRLVFIGRDLDRQGIEDLFAAFCDEPRPDTPDASALFNNPLAL